MLASAAQARAADSTPIGMRFARVLVRTVCRNTSDRDLLRDLRQPVLPQKPYVHDTNPEHLRQETRQRQVS